MTTDITIHSLEANDTLSHLLEAYGTSLVIILAIHVV